MLYSICSNMGHFLMENILWICSLDITLWCHDGTTIWSLSVIILTKTFLFVTFNLLLSFNNRFALSLLIFARIYFHELKKIVFRKYLFSRIASFWKFGVYKFQPPNKKKE